MRKRIEIRRLPTLILVLTLFLSLSGCGGEPPVSDTAEKPFEGLELTLFDAGKADAILLTTPSSAVLIDCGGKDFGSTLVNELAVRGIGRLDLLIITHFDKDHVGGAAKLLANIEVARVLQCGIPGQGSAYDKYLRALNKTSLEPETVRETLSFSLGGVAYTVDPPQRESYDRDQSNNSSLIVTAVHGENRLVFLGDAETARISEYLASSPAPCGFLKIPHHGQEEKLLGSLIAALRPEYAAITCSDREPEASSTAELLAANGVTTFLTRLGAVRVRSDGKTLRAEYIG